MHRYDHAPCGLLSTTASGEITHVNRTFCAWLAYRDDELIGRKRIQDLLTMGGKIFHQTHWLPLLQLQGTVAEVQLELVHKDGRALPALVNAVVREGQHDLAVFAAADRRTYERELLNARRRAETLLESERAAQEQLALARAGLQSALEQRATVAEQLVGIVSHDLRTPLSVISMGSNLLASTDIKPEQRRILSRIASAGTRATRLIGDLLDFTQSRLGGGLHVTPVELDLPALLDDSVAELHLANAGRMIEHHHHGETKIKADPDRLTQVLTNLVSNALTYGLPERPVTVTSRADAQLASISVHNWGTPIPPALLPHIFEPLRRGQQQVKLGSRSVGLGLYIVSEIALAHKGTVVVESTAEGGTRFTVTIPAA